MYKPKIYFILNCIKASPDIRISTSGTIGALSPPEGPIGYEKSKTEASLLIQSEAIIFLESFAIQHEDERWSSNAVQWQYSQKTQEYFIGQIMLS